MRMVARITVSHLETIAVAAAATTLVSFAARPLIPFSASQFVRTKYIVANVFDGLATGQLSQTDYPFLLIDTENGVEVLLAAPLAVINPLGPNGSIWITQVPDIYYRDFLAQAGQAGPGLFLDIGALVKNADAANPHSVTLQVIGIFEIWDEDREEL